MDGTLFRRTLLAAAFGLGIGATLAHAGGPVTPVSVSPQAPAVVVINGMVYTNTGVAAPAPAAAATAVPVVATVPDAPTAPTAPTTSAAPTTIAAPTIPASPTTPAVPTGPAIPAASAAPAAPAAAPCATCGNADGSAPKKHWYNFNFSFWHDDKDKQGEHKQIGCWAHFNNYSCGSWESEAAFMFGSCRNFFGEPCMGPPEPAFPGEKPPRNICPNCARP